MKNIWDLLGSALEQFVSLEDRKRTNLTLTFLGAFIAWAIYNKPEVFGPWIAHLFALADLQTWLMIIGGVVLVYNTVSLQSERMSERFKSLEVRLEERDREIEALTSRMTKMEIDHAAEVAMLIQQRDRVNTEAGVYRSTIIKLYGLASVGGKAEEANDLVSNLEKTLENAKLRSLSSAPQPGGRRADDPEP